MNHQPSAAYLTLWKLWVRLSTEGAFVKKGIAKKSLLTATVEDVDELEVVVPGDYSYVNSDTFLDLSKAATNLVTVIMVELKMNNTLWAFSSEGRGARLIAELRRKEILYKTGTTGIHLVNPFFIRKGRITTVIALMMQLLESTAKVTTDHIRPLKANKRVVLKAWDFLNNT
jgi:hypothetical protein